MDIAPDPSGKFNAFRGPNDQWQTTSELSLPNQNIGF